MAFSIISQSFPTMQSPNTILVTGPSQCGKTTFVLELIRHADKVFSLNPDRIIYCYSLWQPAFESFKRKVEFVEGFPDLQLNAKQRTLLVLDDMFVQAADDTRVSDLFTKGSHHLNATVVLITQNLFFKGQTAYAEEYYDGIEGVGRVNTLVYGDKSSIFYYNETKEILEINGKSNSIPFRVTRISEEQTVRNFLNQTSYNRGPMEPSYYIISVMTFEPLCLGLSCKVSTFENSLYFKIGMFSDWLHHSPLIIGPSAILRFGNEGKAKRVPGDPKVVRGIYCDQYSFQYNDPKNNLTIVYSLAVKNWVTPYQMEGLRVPIRVEVNGISSELTGKANEYIAVNQLFDFVFFRPTIRDSRTFQPPLGIGCYGRQSTKTIPKLPRSFSFSAEIYDIKTAENQAENFISFDRVWFDSETKLVRVDRYSKNGKNSDMYDFNTGTIYRITNDQSCKRFPLRNGVFGTADRNTMTERMKTPEEVFGLDAPASYMGQKRARGIPSDIFEIVKRNVVGSKGENLKSVVTAYFSTEFVVTSVDGELVTQAPVYLISTAYDNKNQVVEKSQYNILTFDDLVPFIIYSTFPIEECFTKPEQRSYFVLMFPANRTTAAAVEMIDTSFLEDLTFSIMEVTGISRLRIPFLKADYEESGIYVTGLILGTESALAEFWWEDTYLARGSEDQKEMPGVFTDGEGCAAACLDETSFVCRAFHFCGLKCYLDSKDPSQRIPTLGSIGNCQIHIRTTINSTKTVSLSKAVKKMQDLVDGGLFGLYIEDKDKKPHELFALEVVFSSGPFNKEEIENDYQVAYKGFQLEDAETTVQYAEASSEVECYHMCTQQTSIDCSSFSFCQTASNKGCRISSVFIWADKRDYDAIVFNTLCNVYSLKYLSGFDAYPGKVFMVSGEEEFPSITSAEECARRCRNQEKFKCLGFEYCRGQKNCVLHSQHMLDMAGKVGSSETQCTHYSAKYSADYVNIGQLIVVDDTFKRSEIGLEQCAHDCSREASFDCKSFSYCAPSDLNSVDSTCALSTLTIAHPAAKTEVNPKCQQYEQRKGFVRMPAGKQQISTSSEGYTSGGLAGLIIGMLIFGIIMGAIGFVLYSYCRSRNSGEGMTVRFMKQGNA